MTLAQRATSDRSGLEEIVVTATRREINLQDVGQSVRAFSTADIERQAFQDVEDVISALPSVNLVNNQPGRNSIIMRGISTGSAEYRTDSQVAVYLDDQPLTSISQQVDIRPIDIERIEALPGPQGTLFGLEFADRARCGYVTNKPDPAQLSALAARSARSATTKGGEASYDVSGHVNLPLNDSFAVRLVGFYSLEGGYVDNVLGPTLMGDTDNADVVEDDWNDAETYGGRIAARWDINPKWQTTLSFVAQNASNDGTWETDGAVGDYKTTRFFDEYRDDDWWQASLNVKGDLGFAELSMTGSYFDRKIKYEWDNIPLRPVPERAHLAPATTCLRTPTWTFGTTYNDQKQSRYAYEVRLTSQGRKPLPVDGRSLLRGRLRLVALPARSYRQPHRRRRPGNAAQYLRLLRRVLPGYHVAVPAARHRQFYLLRTTTTGPSSRPRCSARSTYALTDKLVRHGRRALVRIRPRPASTSTAPRSVCRPGTVPATPRLAERRVESTGKSADTVFKFATAVPVRRPTGMAYAALQRGLPARRHQRCTRAAQHRVCIPREVPARTSCTTTRPAYQEPVAATTACRSTVDFFFMQWDDFQLRATRERRHEPLSGCVGFSTAARSSRRASSSASQHRSQERCLDADASAFRPIRNSPKRHVLPQV